MINAIMIMINDNMLMMINSSCVFSAKIQKKKIKLN